MNAFKFSLIGLVCFLSACDHASSHRDVVDLGQPPTKAGDGNPVFLGNPGEQSLFWVARLQCWQVDMQSVADRFIPRPNLPAPLIQTFDSGGGLFLMPDDPVAGLLGVGRDGDVLTFARRDKLVAAIVDERKGRISIAWTRDEGKSILHQDLGESSRREIRDAKQTLRKLQHSKVCVNADGVAAALLVWRHELVNDTSLLKRREKPSWTEVEIVLLKQDGVARFPLKQWDDRESAGQIDFIAEKSGFRAAVNGSGIRVWSFTPDGTHGPLITVAGNDHVHRSTIFSPRLVPTDAGVLVAWIDGQNSHPVGYPGPWMRSHSIHSQIAICEITADGPGKVQLITPETRSVSNLQAGLTRSGPCLAWISHPVDDQQPDKHVAGESERLEAMLFNAGRK